MTQRAKVLAMEALPPKFDLKNPGKGEKRESAPQNCPDFHTVTCKCHSQTNKKLSQNQRF